MGLVGGQGRSVTIFRLPRIHPWGVVNKILLSELRSQFSKIGKSISSHIYAFLALFLYNVDNILYQKAGLMP
jgi:hypothetical protein